jgi:hypothetical protein
MKVFVDNFVFMNDGRKPRGLGRWVFFFDGELSPLVVSGVTYELAKEAAIRYARAKGHKAIALGI